MAAQRCVGVFWDLENCAVPSRMSGNVAADRIRAAVAHFGKLVEFNAYGDVKMSAISKRHGDLLSAGVCLIHTPHNSKKQVADMHIVADIIAFALDRSEPVTAILISGDGDFVHAISVLQDRGHSVWIISPDGTTSGKLASQADGTMNWRYDVLETPDPRAGSPGPSYSADDEDEVENVLRPMDCVAFSTKPFNCGFDEASSIERWPLTSRQTCSHSYSATSRPVAVQSCFLPAMQSSPQYAPVPVIISTTLCQSNTPSRVVADPGPDRPVRWRFYLLIKVLRELRASDPENKKKLKWYEVAKILQKRDPSVFANYNRPKQYMLKAQSAGVIHMRKEAKGAPQFVYLHPDFY